MKNSKIQDSPIIKDSCKNYDIPQDLIFSERILLIILKILRSTKMLTRRFKRSSMIIALKINHCTND